MRVLVTGSRQILSEHRVYPHLDEAYQGWRDAWSIGEIQRSEMSFTVIHGGAAGADSLAGQWCDDRRSLDIPPQLEVHPAKWGTYGKLAGHIRNAEMVAAGADLVLAFFQPGAENRGTQNCVTTAKLRGLFVREFWS
jgi:hypothetical protein